jgi:hypothetical protein
MEYVDNEFQDYESLEYQTNTVLILDDFMSSYLLEPTELPVLEIISKKLIRVEQFAPFGCDSCGR